MILVRQIFISSGHSFYGRHGKGAADFPLQEVEQVECVAGKGLRGDRFFDYRRNYRGQITFFSGEIFAEMQATLGLPPGFSAANTRRNVITLGVDLNTLIGREFEIQGIRFEGAEECRPCEWMDVAFATPGAEDWLKGNGGLRARILTDGWLRRMPV